MLLMLRKLIILIQQNMKVFYNLFNSQALDKPSNITIGMFDGIHYGHKRVLNQLKEFPNKLNIVITFSNHPSSYFNPDKTYKLLFNQEEKLNFFKNIGIDIVYIIEFNQVIADYPANKFVEEILIKKLNCKNLILGYDNRFGKNREGTIEFVREHYSTEINSSKIEPYLLDNEIVSSSIIKDFILQGMIHKANKFLGFNYFINGRVIKGKELGSKLGFSTANLSIDANKLIPKNGVYLVKVKLNLQEYYGLTNIGVRPTVNSNLKDISIETHILDFNENIYGYDIQIEFLSKIREEKKFKSVEELKKQVLDDIQYTKKLISNI